VTCLTPRPRAEPSTCSAAMSATVSFGRHAGPRRRVGARRSALACKREERRFNDASRRRPHTPPSRSTHCSRRAVARAHRQEPAEGNAYDISEGSALRAVELQRMPLHGGGGMGPPLMDNEWIYGSSPENIVATIVEGRPNGMPSFRNRSRATSSGSSRPMFGRCPARSARRRAPGGMTTCSTRWTSSEHRSYAARVVFAKRSGQVERHDLGGQHLRHGRHAG
jgi:cytochrome c oxidase cbb3-type subunit 3